MGAINEEMEIIGKKFGLSLQFLQAQVLGGTQVICLSYQSVTPFLSGAHPPEKTLGSDPDLGHSSLTVFTKRGDERAKLSPLIIIYFIDCITHSIPGKPYISSLKQGIAPSKVKG